MVIFDGYVSLPDGIFSGKKNVFRSIFLRNNILIHKKHLDTAGFPASLSGAQAGGAMDPWRQDVLVQQTYVEDG